MIEKMFSLSVNGKYFGLRKKFLRVSVLACLLSLCATSLPLRAEAAPAKTETYIVRLKSTVNASSFIVQQIKKGIRPTEFYTSVFPGFKSKLTPSSFLRLKRDSKVLSISKIQTFSVPRKPIVRGVGYVWGLDRIDQKTLPLNNLYSPKTSGAGVSVFVIDTGVDGTHGEFGGRVNSGFSAVTGRAGNSDCHGHGTHVAGTVAGTNVGVARGSTIIPVQVLNCLGQGDTGRILRGIDYVIGLHRKGEPAIANLSLGGGVDAAIDAGIRAMVADGITVVVAAGNSNKDACGTSPAREPIAITVGATSQSDTRASFSNFGRCLDIFAPGVEILSTMPGSRYSQLNGTSMAAPHVAGVAALILEANPTLSPGQVSSLILGGSTSGQVVSRGTGSPNRLLFADVAAPIQPSPSPTTPPTTTPPSLAAPNPIGNLRAIVSSTSIVGIWSAPSGGGQATNYEVGYKRISDSSWTNLDSISASSTSTTIRSLQNGTYVIRVAARNSAGQSTFTESSSVTITENSAGVSLDSSSFKDPWTRSNVTSIRLDSSGGQVSLDVGLSARAGLPNASNQVWGQLCPAGSTYPDVNRCTGSLFPGQSSSGTTGSYSGLFILSSGVQTGTWYATIEVRTTDNAVHLLTIPITIEVLPKLVLSPSAPTGLSVNPSSSSVQLSWSAPTNTGGGSILDYTVEYWAKGGSSWTRVEDGVSAATSTTISSLPQNTYSFRVAAVNSGGTSPYLQSGDIQVGARIEINSDKFMNSFGTSITSIKKSSSGITWVYYEVRLRDPFGGRLPESFGGQLCPNSSNYPFGNWCTGATFQKTAGHSLDATYRGLFGISSAASTGQWKVTFDPTASIRIESPKRLFVS